MKISVVIPNFGHKAYLPLAIQSILNQTYQDFEIIILNDDVCSLINFEQIDNRIKVYDRVCGKRKTSEERLNLIVDELCDIWCYQDADGTSYPKRLELSLEYMQVSDSDIITTDGIYQFAQFLKIFPKYKTIDSQYGVGGMSSVFARKEILQVVPFTKYGYGSAGS